MRDFDHEPRRKREPDELSDWCHGANHGVLVAGKVAVFSKAPDSAIAEDRFVQDLEEVNPDEYR